MKKFWQNNNFLFGTIISFWVLIVSVCIALTIKFLPFTPSFPYYSTDLSPYYHRFTSTFAHFDGIHYLRIAKAGFYPDAGEVAFFPLYPSIIHGLSFLGIDRLYAGIIVSMISFVLAIYILLYIYPEAKWKILVLFLTFPTSFYFLTVYTESLFFLLFALMLFFIKQKKYYGAAAVVALATSTRLVGVGMAAYLIFSIWKQTSWNKIIQLALISLSGLLSYMGYFYLSTGDLLAFIHAQPIFGMGRSGGEIILLPQVIYRYLKMLITLAPTTILYLRVFLELVIFGSSLWLFIKYFTKFTLSEIAYLVIVILTPSLSGTLSSYPRYVLVAVPLVVMIAQSCTWRSLVPYIIIMSLLQIVSVALFTTGLFVA